jgi:hypothetical protein
MHATANKKPPKQKFKNPKLRRGRAQIQPKKASFWGKKTCFTLLRIRDPVP